MTISTVRMMSHALQRPTTYTVIVPEAAQAGPGPYHVLLQLHGYGDDHQAWVLKSNIALYLEKLPLIVVFPNGENSYWLNWEPGRLYEDFLMQDLWAHIEATYPVLPGGALGHWRPFNGWLWRGPPGSETPGSLCLDLRPFQLLA